MVFGKKISMVMNVLLLMGYIVFMAAILMVVGDCFKPIMMLSFGENGFGYRGVYMIFVCLLFIFPLCLVDKIHQSKYFRFLSLFVFIILLCFIILYENATSSNDVNISRATLFKWDLITLTSIPLTAIGFLFNSHLIPIVQRLENRKQSYMLIDCSLSILSIFYVFLGLAGYFSFGDKTYSDILLSLKTKDKTADVARLLLGYSTILTYPILNNTTYISLQNLLSEFDIVNRLKDSPFISNTIASIIIMNVAYLFSMIFIDLATLFGISFCILGSITVLITPAIIQLRIEKKQQEIS